MKTKWYLFILTIATVSMLLYNLGDASPEKQVKIGVVMAGDSRAEKLEGLKQGLKEFGYEMDEFKFIVKNSKDDPSKLDSQIRSLLAGSPDIIVSMGGIETLEVQRIAGEKGVKVPVVFAGVAAPKELGIIKDYKRPGGQITGISNYHTSLTGKRLELLSNLVPSINRVHVIYDQNVSVSRLSLEETKKAAKKLNISILPWNIRDEDFKKNLSSEIRVNDALFVLPSFKIEAMAEELAGIAHSGKIPSMGIYEEDVRNGFLSSYGASFHDQGFQAARYVSLLIQGNSPGELPVELSDSLRFIVSKKEQAYLNLELDTDLMYIAEYSGVQKAREGSGNE